MAYLYPCECGREYVVAASFAGSQHKCLCGILLEIPRLSLLSLLEVAPEPVNKTIELVDPRTISYENEEYVLKKFPVEYECFSKSRSKSELLGLLEEYRLHSFELEQTYETMDRAIRKHRRQKGWEGIIIGLIVIPILIATMIFLILVMPVWKLIGLCVVGMFSVIWLFLKGWYSLVLSSLPNRE